MNPRTLQLALAHAKREHPRESCGLVVALAGGREAYWPCANLSQSAEHFVLSPEDYARAEDAGKIAAIVHSHPRDAQPSQADLVACEATAMPWHIVTQDGACVTFKPTGYRAPLLGREFVHGVLDCYSLVRDYYREVLGVTLPDHERRESWWKNGGNLYLDNYKADGWEEVDQPELHAMLLLQMVSEVPNHAAVFVADNQILHHVQGRISCRDVYGGYWRKHTVKVLRHKCVK